MKDVPDQDFVRFFNEGIPRGFALVGARLISASARDNAVGTTFQLDDRFSNILGSACGGYLALMLDFTCTAAAHVATGHACPTIEMKTNFIRLAKMGSFRGEGAVVKAGRQVVFVQAQLFDGDDKLVATAQLTAMVPS